MTQREASDPPRCLPRGQKVTRRATTYGRMELRVAHAGTGSGIWDPTFLWEASLVPRLLAGTCYCGMAPSGRSTATLASGATLVGASPPRPSAAMEPPAMLPPLRALLCFLPTSRFLSLIFAFAAATAMMALFRSSSLERRCCPGQRLLLASILVEETSTLSSATRRCNSSPTFKPTTPCQMPHDAPAFH